MSRAGNRQRAEHAMAAVERTSLTGLRASSDDGTVLMRGNA